MKTKRKHERIKHDCEVSPTYIVAMPITYHLNLDMSGLVDKFFDQHTIISKGFFRFLLRQTESFDSFAIIPTHISHRK